jgi:hypothetical protein
MLFNASRGLSLWLMIFPAHSPFGLPVHVAASQLAPFSLGQSKWHGFADKQIYKPIMNAKDDKEIVSRYKLTLFQSINK